MDLKIKDVAELLSVTEDTIRKLVVNGEIPAYKLNRQYRFSRIEIENWMMKQKTKTSKDKGALQEKQIYPRPQEDAAAPRSGMQQFSLYRALNRGGVYMNVPGKNKEELIRNSVGFIADQLKLDPDVLSEMLLDREKLMPTAFNNGVAVPHTRESLQHVPFDLIAVVFPEKPIEYGALDGKPVDTLFFLFATGDKIHLHLLAKIAHLCSHSTTLNFIKSRPDKTTLLEFIREWEGHLKNNGE